MNVQMYIACDLQLVKLGINILPNA